MTVPKLKMLYLKVWKKEKSAVFNISLSYVTDSLFTNLQQTDGNFFAKNQVNKEIFTIDKF